MMAGEPEGCGPNATCLATWLKARAPSKPPVLSAGKASTGVCGAAVVTALMKGGLPAVFGAAVLDLQPEKVRKRNTAANLAKRPKEGKSRIYLAPSAARRLLRLRVTTAETMTPM